MTAFSIPVTDADAPRRQRAELILGQLDQLPTLPAVAVRLLATLSADDSSTRDVVEIIEADPALTTAVLRLATRADKGVRREGLTVAKAVPLLGFTALRRLVLTVKVFDTLRPRDAKEPDVVAAIRDDLWLHNIAVACAAEMLAAQTSDGIRTGDAFVCGLLHDIGKIALDAALPKGFARVIERVQRERVCICDVERDLLGVDHTVAGKRLLSRWGLPTAVVESAWLHHQSFDTLPSNIEHAAVVRIVHAADDLVRRQHIGFSGYQHTEEPNALADGLGIAVSALDDVIDRLPERMRPMCELLGLGDLTGTRLYAESVAKANSELLKVNEQLTAVNRQLSVRSACFDLLSRFSYRLTRQDRPEHVCQSAAIALRDGLGIAPVVAFAGRADSRFVHIGVADDKQGRDDALLEELDAQLSRALWSGTRLEFGPAETTIQSFWQVIRPAAPGKLWLWPLVEGGRLVGGAVLPLSEWRAEELMAADDAHAVSSAIGLAITSAMTRIEAERMTDELLDLNRRIRVAEAQLLRTRSLAMVAKMAGGAAHELNTPLAVISGRAQMLQREARDENVKRNLGIIAEQAHVASGIVDELLTFAKPPTPKPVPVSVRDLLQTVCQHWQQDSEVREGDISLQIADERANVYGDPEQLRLVLDALVANAIQYSEPNRRRIVINSPSRASDERVRIVVEDNGVGMTREVLEHAIDPFYSQRPAGRGRGLGLSRAHRLTELNGGELWLESTPQQGTRATIALPTRAPRS